MRVQKNSTYRFIIVILIFTFLESGCAVLNMPLKLVGGMFQATWGLLSGLMKIADKLPKPPPGVF